MTSMTSTSTTLGWTTDSEAAMTSTDAPAATTMMTREVRQMRLVMLVIGLQFIIPAISYLVDPSAAVATMVRINELLGGTAWDERGHVWNMLAVGNVMTLGFLCLLLRVDVVRFLPALPGLLFLKAFSAFFSLGIAIVRGVPAFYAVFVLDFSTTLLMGAVCLRAAWSLAADRSCPWWARWILVTPERVEQGLARVARAQLVPVVPNLWQIFLASLAMWRRLLFRSDTVGTSTAPVRSTWRARLLHVRALRLPFLLWEQAIAPLDCSGLIASPERVIQHLLKAHHEGIQLIYDLELLRLYPGARERALALAHSVVDGTHPRASWLRDLCVHEGYHESLVAALERELRGELEDSDSGDIGLRAMLRWAASMPKSPVEMRGRDVRIDFA